MVSIRLQRTGRRRHAQFRVVVQDSRFTPTSGRVVANLGFYNPHTKEHNVDLEKAVVYLKNGAQPSPRLVKFFIDQKVDLPGWVERPDKRTAAVKNPDKLRRNRPPVAEEAEDETPNAPSEPPAAEPAETEAAEPADQDDDKTPAEPAKKPVEMETENEKPEAVAAEEGDAAEVTPDGENDEAEAAEPADQDDDKTPADNGEKEEGN